MAVIPVSLKVKNSLALNPACYGRWILALCITPRADTPSCRDSQLSTAGHYFAFSLCSMANNTHGIAGLRAGLPGLPTGATQESIVTSLAQRMGAGYSR